MDVFYTLVNVFLLNFDDIQPLLDKKSYVEGFALFAADVKKAKLHKDSLRANKERLVAFHDVSNRGRCA